MYIHWEFDLQCSQKQTDTGNKDINKQRMNSGMGRHSGAVSTCVCVWHRCNQCNTEDVTMHLEGRPALWMFHTDAVSSLSGHKRLHKNNLIFMLLATVIFCMHLHFHFSSLLVNYCLYMKRYRSLDIISNVTALCWLWQNDSMLCKQVAVRSVCSCISYEWVHI